MAKRRRASYLSPQVAIVYKDAIDNLIFFKKEQWTRTNYAFAIYAAIYFIGTHHDSGMFERGLLLGILFLTCAFSLFYLLRAQMGMTKFRRRLAYINMKYFTAKERRDLSLKLSPKSFFYDFDFFLGFTFATIAGAVLAGYFGLK